jgi:hypothetical protein
MTGVSLSGSKEHFTNEYADPSICYYYSYMCTYCERLFRLVYLKRKEKRKNSAKNLTRVKKLLTVGEIVNI